MSPEHKPASHCPKGGFARLPHAVGFDPRLSETARLIALAIEFLAMNDPVISHSNETIATVARISLTRTKDGLSELVRLSHLRRERVPVTAANMTGRIIRVLWKPDPATGYVPTYLDGIEIPDRFGNARRVGRPRRDRKGSPPAGHPFDPDGKGGTEIDPGGSPPAGHPYGERVVCQPATTKTVPIQDNQDGVCVGGDPDLDLVGDGERQADDEAGRTFEAIIARVGQPPKTVAQARSAFSALSAMGYTSAELIAAAEGLAGRDPAAPVNSLVAYLPSRLDANRRGAARQAEGAAADPAGTKARAQRSDRDKKDAYYRKIFEFKKRVEAGDETAQPPEEEYHPARSPQEQELARFMYLYYFDQGTQNRRRERESAEAAKQSEPAPPEVVEAPAPSPQSSTADIPSVDAPRDTPTVQAEAAPAPPPPPIPPAPPPRLEPTPEEIEARLLAIEAESAALAEREAQLEREREAAAQIEWARQVEAGWDFVWMVAKGDVQRYRAIYDLLPDRERQECDRFLARGSTRKVLGLLDGYTPPPTADDYLAAGGVIPQVAPDPDDDRPDDPPPSPPPPRPKPPTPPPLTTPPAGPFVSPPTSMSSPAMASLLAAAEARATVRANRSADCDARLAASLRPDGGLTSAQRETLAAILSVRPGAGPGRLVEARSGLIRDLDDQRSGGGFTVVLGRAWNGQTDPQLIALAFAYAMSAPPNARKGQWFQAELNRLETGEPRRRWKNPLVAQMRPMSKAS